MSVRTMYSYLNKSLFTARDIDLKRKVRFKPRKCHKTQNTNRAVFSSRLYSDFCKLELASYVEMDTVHSSKESKKTLLTLFFTKEKLFRSSLFLSLDIIIHIHQVPDGIHVVGDVGVAADGVLDGAAGYGEIDHVHRLIVVHHGVDQAAGKGVAASHPV